MQKLSNWPLTVKQKMHMIDTIIRVGITCSFYVVPYYLSTIKKLDK